MKMNQHLQKLIEILLKGGLAVTQKFCLKREHNLTGSPNDESSDSLDESKITPKVKMGGDIQFMGHPVDGPSSLSVWARKERKFQCDLCPSSFKRASHLNRHQLVHTGKGHLLVTSVTKHSPDMTN
ncbi:hypothetical protein NQ317_005545 [Molorchus minor]|uniref:C2H2-type domain-containing protein n=1 Tax=Molorchus minor TaxID=1323400 RepID=A0ABQ9JWY7_9CUCU|nr:hypothetical protein NQ317_005545 [Molorchus minor]